VVVVEKSDEVLEMPQLGCRMVLRQTAADTNGELLEIDVLGQPKGMLLAPHVHERQSERYEVIVGAMKVVAGGEERLLRPGDSAEVGPGVAHRQLPGEKGVHGHVRIQVRPAGSTEGFIRRLADMCAAGDFNRFGFPKAVAGARLVADFGAEGHAARPPLRVQMALSRLVLGAADLQRPYEFVDEWDVAAPPAAVFDAIADARTYPQWWRPVYLDVDADGPAELGKESRQHFKGRLPYHLHTRSRVVALDPPRSVTADVDGDLRGRGTWTLTPTATGTHVRFDWRVHADRRLLRLLTPLLRPALRWNHAWAIARAMEGLEPYARATASR
jgi:uncharacterized protein YndB with AHSA1/START domain/mannose-6-phosphate isomerase-like protein (cupin superfamily)